MNTFPLTPIIVGTLIAGISAFSDEFIPNPIILPKQEVQQLGIGEKLPEFELWDIYSNKVSSKDFSDAKVLVVAFICNHCPTAQAYEDRLIAFTEAYKSKGVEVIGIMPNSVSGLLLEECGYSDLNDSFPEMKIRAEYKGYNFPYLYDGDDHAASLKFGPSTTPQVYVFDQNQTLQYVGRIDAHEAPGTGHSEDLIAAVDALLLDQTPEIQQTKAFGCSVKWSWKLDWAKKVNEDWAAKPVELQHIQTESLPELLSNDSDKLLLINLWATWCAPCVMEYPEFIATHRMYSGRDFEFVSISMDRLSAENKVKKFLEKSESAVRNYIFSGDDKFAFMEALSAEWNGALPFSLLIEPGGTVIWTHQGPVDFLELRRTIVEHERIGRYY